MPWFYTGELKFTNSQLTIKAGSQQILEPHKVDTMLAQLRNVDAFGTQEKQLRNSEI